ncbi:hypothetical protein [Streptomyces sp. NPDC059788]|uniref:hypothetical protein n=1 Tax=Streptomyces sp. NPDC059788 TaxID=3346948 RepID=UPI003658AD38
MASLVYFKKLSEDSDSVVYSFGGDPSQMVRQLTMDRNTHRPQPDEEGVDYLFLKASYKIAAMYNERNEWPERGMSAS